MSSQKIQVEFVASEKEVTSIGFWLPVGRANFFHAKHDLVLLNKANNLNNDLDFNISTALISNYREEKPLNTSVYRRLLTISEHYDYKYAIPYYPSFRLDYLNVVEDSDPNSLLLVSKDNPLGNGNNYCLAVKRIILVVSDDGFYQWFFYHTSQDNYSEFVAFLKNHLYSMLGNLMLYKSDPEKNPHELTSSHKFGRRFGQQTLDTYSNNNGMLVSFQLNLIFEGLNNALYDPRLFFATHQSKDNINTDNLNLRTLNLEENEYSLSGFIKEIVTYTDCFQTSKDNNKSLIELFNSIEDLSNSSKNREKRNHLKELIFGIYHNDFMRRDFLRQFLRKTSSLHLQILKWNLEDCRRELLPYVISFEHYQQQLVQLPSNDQRSTEFYGINEAQLAGYIKLVSAKFPLVQNVKRDIELAFGKIDKEVSNDIQGFYNDWIGRVEAIINSTKALEQALDRVNEERQLQEQSQIRREQETQAEIARRQQRIGSSVEGGTGNTPLSGLSNNVLTLLGAAGALAGLIYTMSQPWKVEPWAVYGLIPLLGLFLIFIVVVEIYGRAQARKYHISNRFFHEIDLLLEVPMDSQGASTLFVKGLKGKLHTIQRNLILVPGGLIDSSADKLISQEDENFGSLVENYLDISLPKFPRFEKVEQVSYRYSHGHFNEGAHKVHYEFEIHWPYEITRPFADKINKLLWKTPFFSNPHVMKDCELIYEVLSHSPSSKVEHMLREIRFIATYKKKLTPEEVMYLKLKLVNNFILRWLPERLLPLRAEILDNVLPLFSLTIAVLNSPKKAQKI